MVLSGLRSGRIEDLSPVTVGVGGLTGGGANLCDRSYTMVALHVSIVLMNNCSIFETDRKLQVIPRLTAATPMDNPDCSCKLTRVRSRCRTW